MCIFSFWKTRWGSFNQLKRSNLNGQHKQKQCEQKMKSKTKFLQNKNHENEDLENEDLETKTSKTKTSKTKTSKTKTSKTKTAKMFPDIHQNFLMLIEQKYFQFLLSKPRGRHDPGGYLTRFWTGTCHRGFKNIPVPYANFSKMYTRLYTNFSKTYTRLYTKFPKVHTRPYTNFENCEN